MALFNKEELKVGDKVLKIGRYEAIPQVSTIESITKSGNIKVDGKVYYDNGHERTSDRHPSYNIIPFSQKVIDDAETAKNNKKFSQEVWNRMKKLMTDYSHHDMDMEKSKVLDAALKEIGY